MFIKLSGDIFKTEIFKLLQKSRQVAVHLWLENGILYLQANDLLSDNLRISKVQSDVRNSDEIAVYFDQSISLLSDKEDVTINIVGDMLELKQDSYVYNAVALPEQRIESSVFDVNVTSTFCSDSFISFIHDVKALDEVSKTLAKGYASINIENKIAYVKYSNTVFMESLPLPDISLPSEQARKLSELLSRGKNTTKYKYDEENSLMHILAGTDEMISLMTKKANLQVTREIQQVLCKCVEITTINLFHYAEYMNIISRTYKKTIIEFAVCKDGVRFYIDNSKTKINVGSKRPSLVSIRISTAQLGAINKLFGNTTIDIKRGENFICLQDKNSSKTLIVTGMLF